MLSSLYLMFSVIIILWLTSLLYTGLPQHCPRRCGRRKGWRRESAIGDGGDTRKLGRDAGGMHQIQKNAMAHDDTDFWITQALERIGGDRER